MKGKINTKEGQTGEAVWKQIICRAAKHNMAKIAVFSTLFITIFLLLVAVALAQVQSHRLSEIRVIDTDLDLNIYQLNASNVNSTNAYSNVYYDKNNLAYYVDPANAAIAALFNGNVGIGTATPTDKLHVQGNATVTGNTSTTYLCLSGDCRNIWPSLGDAGNVSGAGSANHVPYWENDENITYDPDGNFYWNSSTNMLGIGTTTPSTKLHVQGNATVTGNTSTTYLCLDGDCRNAWPAGAGDAGNVSGAGSAGHVTYWANDENITYDSDGNFYWNSLTNMLGIGTTGPNERLTVVGNINVTGNITAGVGTVFIDGTNSKVGIGTTDPIVPLHVNSSATRAEFMLEGTSLGGLIYFRTQGSTNAQIYSMGATNDLIFQPSSGGNIGIGDSASWPSAQLFVQQTDAEDVFRANDESSDTTPFVIDQDGNVGIGTTNPNEKLTVNGSVNVTGNITVGTGTVFIDGTNSRVGVGTASPTAQLDMDYSCSGCGYGAAAIGDTGTSATGDYAIALGYSTNASGDYSTAIGRSSVANNSASTAIGRSSVASGAYSIAMGRLSVASGDYSTAIGQSTKASGYSSTAMGYLTIANNTDSTAMGKSSIASGSYSTAMGQSTKASGSYSTAMGSQTIANNSGATAMGRYSVASGLYSTAMGRSTVASGEHSTAMGRTSVASGDYSTAIGRGMEAQGNYSVAIALNDQSGTVVSDSNVMSIMGGNVGINTTDPVAMLHVQGGTIIGNASGSGNLVSNVGVYGTGSYAGVYGEYSATRLGILGSSNYGAYGKYDNNNFGYLGDSMYGVFGQGSTAGVRGYYNDSNVAYLGHNKGYGILSYGSVTAVNATGGMYGIYGYGESYPGFFKGNETSRVFIGDANLCIENDPVPNCAEGEGDIIVYDGSMCIGNNGCTPPSGDGNLYVEGTLNASSYSYGCGTYVAASVCPIGNANGPNCDDVPVGSFCEGDGECGTGNIDTCGTYDWYFRTG